VLRLRVHDDTLLRLAVSRGGHFLASSGQDPTVRAWHLAQRPRWRAQSVALQGLARGPLAWLP
jgi:hypothetical protein